FVGVMSEAIVYFLAGYWFRKLHPLVFVIIAGIFFSIRWFLYGVVDDPWIIIALQVLHGFTFGVFFIAAFDYVTRLIPNLLMSTGPLVFFAFIGILCIIRYFCVVWWLVCGFSLLCKCCMGLLLAYSLLRLLTMSLG